MSQIILLFLFLPSFSSAEPSNGQSRTSHVAEDNHMKIRNDLNLVEIFTPEEAPSGGELKNGVEVSGCPSEACILINAQEQERGFLPFC